MFNHEVTIPAAGELYESFLLDFMLHTDQPDQPMCAVCTWNEY